jgi:adenylate kinase
MRAVFIGPPGSGKGTQAKLLQERLGFVCIGTGDILRENVAQGTSLGRQADEFMRQGQLVPDELVNGMVADRLGRADRPEHFILDGYPRNVAQARTLDANLRRLDLTLMVVVLFTIDDEMVAQRMLSRKRVDDTEETVRVRIRLYHEASRDLIAYYKQQGLVREIGADGLVEHLYVKVAGTLLGGKSDSCYVSSSPALRS